MESRAYLESPLGILEVISSARGITSLNFLKKAMGSLDGEGQCHLFQATRELQEFFAGERRSFDVSLDLRGTDFQKKVWMALAKIPYGQTCSYQDLAVKVKSPKGQRAVGMANNRNPVPVIIPCHRVIGKDGKLVGYGGGLPIKKWLLDFESSES